MAKNKYVGKHLIFVTVEVHKETKGTYKGLWFWRFLRETQVRGPFQTAQAAWEDASGDGNN